VTLDGGASPAGTQRYAARFPAAAAGHFRSAGEWTASSIGLGTYLGDDDASTDDQYRGAMARALSLGCNVLDTAINYRHQRSERVIGATLRELVGAGTVTRDQVIVATKGGFIPFESGYAGGMRRYVEETFLKPGIMTADDVAAGIHCMTPRYLRHQLDASRRNLDCALIDIYYLHNPETQLAAVGRERFATRVRGAFEVLEEAAAAGTIGVYGTATWNGFRLAPGTVEWLSLRELVEAAREVGGDRHHFRAVQLPFNLAMPEAYAAPTQLRHDRQIPLLDAAAEQGVMVMASASLLQARLTHGLPPELGTALDGRLTSDAQRALQFARSAPGLTAALVGMSDAGHVEENLRLVGVPPVGAGRFRELFR